MLNVASAKTTLECNMLEAANTLALMYFYEMTCVKPDLSSFVKEHWLLNSGCTYDNCSTEVVVEKNPCTCCSHGTTVSCNVSVYETVTPCGVITVTQL